MRSLLLLAACGLAAPWAALSARAAHRAPSRARAACIAPRLEPQDGRTADAMPNERLRLAIGRGGTSPRRPGGPRGAPRAPPHADVRGLPPMAQAFDAAKKGNSSGALLHACAALGGLVPVGVRECNRLLRELGDAGHLDAMVGVFDAMHAADVQPTQVTYGTLISRAGAQKQPQLASRMYRDMLRRGMQPDAQTFNSLINAYAKAGDVSKAFTTLKAMKTLRVTPTLVTYNTLLDACARGNNVSLSYATLREVQRVGLAPDARTFSILIHLCARTSNPDQGFEWLKRMLAAGQTPNAVTFTTLINACGRAGQLERAFAALAEMTAAGLTPNVVTYTTLIDACAKAMQLPRALDLFRGMIAAGIAPNRITCNVLFHGCLTGGEVLLAREVLQHMASVGVRPSAHSFTALLAATAKLDASQHHSAAVACLLRQMAIADVGTLRSLIGGGGADAGAGAEADGSIGLLRDGASANPAAERDVAAELAAVVGPAAAAAAGAAAGVSEERLAEELLVSKSLADVLNRTADKPRGVRYQRSLAMMDTLLSARLHPPSALWCELFDCLHSPSELQAALKRLRRGQTAGLYPALYGDGTVRAALMEATSRVTPGFRPPGELADERAGGVTDDGPRLVDGGYVAGALPASARELTIQPFLSGDEAPIPLSASLASVFAVFTEMRAAGIAPDRAAFNALINACASVGDVARAEGAFGEMCAAGISPDAISYTCIIKACAVATPVRVGIAMRIHSEMQQRTNHFSTFTPPTTYTYHHLMAVHERGGAGAGAAEHVLRLFDEMRARGIRPAAAHYAMALRAAAHFSELPLSLERALGLYAEMRAAGLRLDTRTLLELDQLCRHHGRRDVAARLRAERSKPSP